MTVADRYRIYAKECETAAARSAMQRDRTTFLEMAERWRDLAEQAEAGRRPVEGRTFSRRPGC